MPGRRNPFKNGEIAPKKPSHPAPNRYFSRVTTTSRFIIIVVAGLAAAAVAPFARATTIFDNTPFTQNGAQFIQVPNFAGSGSYAQAFSTTAQDATISEIRFLLFTISAGTYSADIYASNGSTPTGPALANVFSGSATLSSPVTVSGLNIALSPSTEYFVAVSVTSGSLGWFYTNADTSPNTTLNAFSDGTGWQTSSVQPLQMKVSAVPEPSTWALVVCVGGLGAAALTVRNRSSNARR